MIIKLTNKLNTKCNVDKDYEFDDLSIFDKQADGVEEKSYFGNILLKDNIHKMHKYRVLGGLLRQVNFKKQTTFKLTFFFLNKKITRYKLHQKIAQKFRAL